MQSEPGEGDRGMKKFRLFWAVVLRCQLEKAVIGFIAAFFFFSCILWAAEPAVKSFGDAMWFLFVSCTTIGYGDIIAVTWPGRLSVVVMTIYGMVLLALVTGVVVSHYQEILARREKETIAVFLDKMEHLTELSPQELEQIQEKVRRLDRTGRMD